MLDERSVGPYLQRRGVLPGPPEAVEALGGGVSNIVLLVQRGDQRVVVKQSRPRLRVAGRWFAKQERVLSEASALSLMAEIAPSAVPRVLAVDPCAYVLVIEAAPAGWRTWKSALLGGDVRHETGARLGALLGAWHRDTESRDVPDDVEALEQLRLDPYHRTVAARHPALATRILGAVEELRSADQCLVHGDYSPKNVLIPPQGAGLCVIDCEVAHRGAPVFDLAFLLSHLVLKALHRPASAASLRLVADGFLGSYAQVAARPDQTSLALHVGCLLLARVDGTSPVEYLSQEEVVTVRSLATGVIRDPRATLEDVWDRLPGAGRGGGG